MAEGPTAPAAEDLDAFLAQGEVRAGDDATGHNAVEGRPPATAVEFGRCTVKWLFAAGTLEVALCGREVIVPAAERVFRALPTQDVELIWRENLGPVGIACVTRGLVERRVVRSEWLTAS